MKKILYMLALGAVVGCQKSEPDLLFGKTASERMEVAKQELRQTLSAAPNGWKLTYFTVKGFFGGFTILMKFDPNGRVVMTSDIENTFEPRESSYQIQEGQGPLLVFTTKNYIHDLADSSSPRDLMPSGYLGEFQFVYFGKEGNKLKFRTQRKDTQQFVYFEPATADEWNSMETYHNVATAISGSYYAKVITSAGAENYYMTFNHRLLTFTSMDNREKVFETGMVPIADGLALEPPLKIEGKSFTKLTSVPGTSPTDYTATVDGVTLELHSLGDPSLEFESQGDKISTDFNALIPFGQDIFKNSPYMSPDFFRDFYTIDEEREFVSYEMIFNSATQMTLRVGYLFPGEHEQSYLTYNCTYEVRDKKLYITYVEENPELDAFWTNPDNEEIATLARQRLHNFIALSSEGLYIWKTPTTVFVPIYYIKSIAQPNYYFPSLSF